MMTNSQALAAPYISSGSLPTVGAATACLATFSHSPASEIPPTHNESGEARYSSLPHLFLGTVKHFPTAPPDMMICPCGEPQSIL